MQPCKQQSAHTVTLTQSKEYLVPTHVTDTCSMYRKTWVERRGAGVKGNGSKNLWMYSKALPATIQKVMESP